MGGEQHPVADRHHQPVEAGRLQEYEQSSGIHRVVGIPLVELVELLAGEAVRAHQHPAGAKQTVDRAEDLELRVCSRDVVEHREAAKRVEGLIGEGTMRRVADLDGDVGDG